MDADPDANLGSALGIDTSGIVPVAKMEALITERTGLAPGNGRWVLQDESESGRSPGSAR